MTTRALSVRLAGVIAAALPLAACISFGAEPPASLATLTPTATLAAGTVRTASDGQTVIVSVPIVPQELSTPRVPVQTGATSVAYLKDAQWIDVPNRLFRELLAETIAATTGRAVLDPRQSSLAGGIRIGGRLNQFGLDSASRSVVVIYDATMAREGAKALQTRRFEARVPITAETPAAGLPALNQAANQGAGEVAGWVG
ncbi:ABC-type transport auxiliary lipoprotein family protein [Sphingomonas solaris]|uniref:ABC transporter n=1 Tax=Alterirhizorhabdus solaris TaxID=2529389 RepID=A0A558QY46_9SPHN|nr:ABC-type transport auxiliary lipoprotein family protein [Sphingomonas solaris]TVV72060.1 ABC transporter [Sphingomonas solaris]